MSYPVYNSVKEITLINIHGIGLVSAEIYSVASGVISKS